ncbi:MAG: DNA mismatch repair endonuclease MutL, partial [Kiritimatiellaeota bacterium]|nr:DNA mismatch repair endonuclease MutL [Kiritimatiellota bacterium]
MHVANQIAAGEVVERPASVVKELMENSLDAGARRIEVTVVAGGRKRVTVADDGRGMIRDDAIMAIERQATSKLRSAEDLEHIATLGFRGEALASIAAVSRFSLKTRHADSDEGTEVVVTGGTLSDVRSCGGPVGTTIDVQDIFFNLPARRKFLRTFQTEQAQIKAGFCIQALAHPEVAMKLTCDGEETYLFPACESLTDRLRDVYGAEALAKLRPVEATSGTVRVWGFAGVPATGNLERTEQIFLVNRR